MLAGSSMADMAVMTTVPAHVQDHKYRGAGFAGLLRLLH